MRDTLAFEILTTMMSDDWRADSPLPSTSHDLDAVSRMEGNEVCLDPVIAFQGGEVCLDSQGTQLDPGYEETLQSLYSEESQSDPLWNSVSTSLSTSPPTTANSIDFLSDDSFMDASMTDVKGELKSRIKAKRLASGQEELSIEDEKPKEEPKLLTEEDVKLDQERKEKNRLAAQKCRNKKRERAETLEYDIERLENKQDHLKDEIQRLQDEREHLQEVIQIHGVVCPKIRKLGDS